MLLAAASHFSYLRIFVPYVDDVTSHAAEAILVVGVYHNCIAISSSTDGDCFHFANNNNTSNETMLRSNIQIYTVGSNYSNAAKC